MLARHQPKFVPPILARTLFRISLTILALGHQSVDACMTYAPFVVSDIRHADAIFTGNLIRYEIVSPEEQGTLQDYGLLTIDVREKIKGDVPEEVQLYWRPSTFGLPEKLRLTDPAIFAAVNSDTASLPLRGPSATFFPSRRPELMQLMHAPCSSAFLFPYSERAEADLRSLLKGTSIPQEDLEMSLFIGDVSSEFHEIDAIHISERSSWVILIAGAFAMGAIALAALWLWRRQKQRYLGT